MTTRRDILKGTLPLLALAGSGSDLLARSAEDRWLAGGLQTGDALDDRLIDALRRPVLKREYFPDPVVIESVELLKNGNYYLVRVRSEDGAEGIAVSNESRMRYLWPIFVGHVAQFFKGKDARDLDDLIQQCFEARSFYKFQSLAIWIPIASAEFAILDMLGQIAGVPVGALFGEIHRTDIQMYYANNHRGKPAEESARLIKETYDRHNPPAIKFKIAGRMSSPDEPPGRSEKLIPLVREMLGDDVVIYADANGGYDVDDAIRIGRLLEDINAGFFEEPCPFDHLEETRAVADALSVDVAGGEQEASMRRFHWMAANDGVQVLQPDILYFGGFVRSIRVARMAEVVGAPCTPHMSGAGLGMLYVLHYASVIRNSGPHQEYKGPNRDIPYEASRGNLDAVDGVIPVPDGPGLGVRIDPDWVAASRVLTQFEM